MENDVGGGKISGHRKPRAYGALIHEQLVVIPANTRVNTPFPKMDHVLQESRLLQVRVVAVERKGCRCAGIKLGWIGDNVAETFVQKSSVGFHTGLPFLVRVMDGNGPLEIALVKAIVLKRNDRRG